MARLLLVMVLWLAWVASVDATVERGPACCACQSPDDTSLFCAVVTPANEDATAARCEALGGGLLCKANEPDRPCNFSGLNCPASTAPALSSVPLGALAALLAVGGFVALRHRPRHA